MATQLHNAASSTTSWAAPSDAGQERAQSEAAPPAELGLALRRLEQSLRDVRNAACAAARNVGAPMPSLRVLDDLEQAIQRLRAPTSCTPQFESDAQRKTTLARDALWAARKELRRLHPAAVERLASIDIDGVDPRAVQEVYGAWLMHGRRLAIRPLFHYEEGFGRGVLLAPYASGGLEVISAIGIPRWPAGTRLDWSDVPGARPVA
jgi:hypothetical protein